MNELEFEFASRGKENRASAKANRDTVLSLLKEAHATEIMAFLRYKHDSQMARGIEALSVAEEFRKHAEEELDHMDRLASRITQLNGEPDYDPESFASKSRLKYSQTTELLKMIEESLVAERGAVDLYLRMIGQIGDQDPTTRRLFEKILSDEEEHAADLSKLLGEKHLRKVNRYVM